MTRGLLSDLVEAALVDAVKGVEQGSTAEVVLAVRGRSSPHIDLDLTYGIVFACFALWFQLFSPWDFQPAPRPDPIFSRRALVSSGELDRILSRIEMDDSYAG